MLKLRTKIFALRLAMSFQKAALSNLGGVEMHKGDFRAHLQFRDEEGTNTHTSAALPAQRKGKLIKIWKKFELLVVWGRLVEKAFVL